MSTLKYLYLSLISITVFLAFIGFVFPQIASYEKMENAVTTKYKQNSGIFITREELPPYTALKVSGYTVFSDILNETQNYTFFVENKNLNDITLSNHKVLLTEARTTNPDLLLPYILLNRTYNKEMILDDTGKLTTISYSVIN